MPIKDGVFQGDYPDYLNGGYHGAADFPTKVGTPVYAAFSGTIGESRTDASYGNNIVIYSDYNNETYMVIYAHLDSKVSSLKVGDTVKVGALIGYSGETGNVTGPHLHFEIRRPPYKFKLDNVDPESFYEL